MKFGKLLAAGKSWAGGNGIGRYQMRDGLALPKFISPRNPFKQESVAGSRPHRWPPLLQESCERLLPTGAGAKKFSLAARVGNGVKRVLLFCLDHNPFSAIGKPKLPRDAAVREANGAGASCPWTE